MGWNRAGTRPRISGPTSAAADLASPLDCLPSRELSPTTPSSDGPPRPRRRPRRAGAPARSDRRARRGSPSPTNGIPFRLSADPHSPRAAAPLIPPAPLLRRPRPRLPSLYYSLLSDLGSASAAANLPSRWPNPPKRRSQTPSSHLRPPDRRIITRRRLTAPASPARDPNETPDARLPRRATPSPTLLAHPRACRLE